MKLIDVLPVRVCWFYSAALPAVDLTATRVALLLVLFCGIDAASQAASKRHVTFHVSILLHDGSMTHSSMLSLSLSSDCLCPAECTGFPRRSRSRSSWCCNHEVGTRLRLHSDNHPSRGQQRWSVQGPQTRVLHLQFCQGWTCGETYHRTSYSRLRLGMCYHLGCYLDGFGIHLLDRFPRFGASAAPLEY